MDKKKAICSIAAFILIAILFLIIAHNSNQKQYDDYDKEYNGNTDDETLSNETRADLIDFYAEHEAEFKSYGISLDMLLEDVNVNNVDNQYCVPIDDAHQFVIIYDEETDTYNMIDDLGTD